MEDPVGTEDQPAETAAQAGHRGDRERRRAPPTSRVCCSPTTSRPCPATPGTAARPRATPPASPTASSTTGPGPGSSSHRARRQGSGSQRLYSFRDILLLKVIKRLLDAGISLQQIRAAVQHLRERGTDDLTRVTLMSDGASVYECTSDHESSTCCRRPGRLRHRHRRRLARDRGTLADLPSERTAEDPVVEAPAAPSAGDELAARRAARATG